METKQTIINLLTQGHILAMDAITHETNIRQSELIAKHALGYFNAARILLDAFAELHNELIDHPLFIEARRFQRKFRF